MVSKEQWLQQVAKDLKDRSPDELVWQAAEGLAVSPFAYREDFPVPPQPLYTTALSGWEIAEHIPVPFDRRAATLHREIMAALEGGAEGLIFECDTLPDLNYWTEALASVYLDYIGLHIAGKGIHTQPGAWLSMLKALAADRSLPTNRLKGSIHWNPLAASDSGTLKPDWRYAADLLEYAAAAFPNLRLLTFSAETTTTHPAKALGQLLSQADTSFTALSEKRIKPEQAAAQMQIEVRIGKSYFLEIAKIRALKILWLNLLKKHKSPLQWPHIIVQFDPEAYDAALNTNLIRATTMAMSAVLGGASRLAVLPYDASQNTPPADPGFGRRIARNVQHLLKMESYLDALNDPAAGSYYIEQLTRQLAEAAWTIMNDERLP
jgi:methylmalonyl-CoA mutase